MKNEDEKKIEIKNSSDGKRRLCLEHRNDGFFQFWEEEQVFDYMGRSCWTPTQAISGIHETKELALLAAQSEFDWMK